MMLTFRVDCLWVSRAGADDRFESRKKSRRFRPCSSSWPSLRASRGRVGRTSGHAPEGSPSVVVGRLRRCFDRRRRSRGQIRAETGSCATSGNARRAVKHDEARSLFAEAEPRDVHHRAQERDGGARHGHGCVRLIDISIRGGAVGRRNGRARRARGVAVARFSRLAGQSLKRVRSAQSEFRSRRAGAKSLAKTFAARTRAPPVDAPRSRHLTRTFPHLRPSRTRAPNPQAST